MKVLSVSGLHDAIQPICQLGKPPGTRLAASVFSGTKAAISTLGV
jgi:hypothetical protein